MTCRKIVQVFCSLTLWLISGCQPGITPAPVPSPKPIFVQVTPALLSLRPLMKECISNQGSSGLVLSETSAQALEIGQPGIGLRWGAPSAPEGYAAQLGDEILVMIISPQNPVSEISHTDLQSIYSGKLRTWPGTQDKVILPWVYPAGDDSQEIFNGGLLAGSSPSSQVVSIAPDPQAMLATISSNPDALGFLPRRWLNETVKEIQVQGIDSSSLRKPILALSRNEPQGLEKDWLLCLQERLVE